MLPLDASARAWETGKPSACLMLSDGRVLYGQGLGAIGSACGEVCFNTAITGYQEILTDPSYANQIITFTFPHIGNVGATPEDNEVLNLATASPAKGCIFRASPTTPSNYRAMQTLDQWLTQRGLIGLCGVDTRALTAMIRDEGMPNAIIAHEPNGLFDLDALAEQIKAFPGIDGSDLVPGVTSGQSQSWTEKPWEWDEGFTNAQSDGPHIVAIDFGAKGTILRLLAAQGFRVTVVPADRSAEDIIALNPDGIFLSNGPGDPAATGTYAVPVIQSLIERGYPTFGICLGHQMLALALGAQTMKMHQGHHGANHPVKEISTGKVEIVSMNHGFAVDRESLPEGVEETHVSLFDGTNCGIRMKDKPVFSVQHHPEASPGPMDSHYLFERFRDLVNAA